MANLFAKKMVTDSTTPYKKNVPTAPSFIIKEEKNFEEEKQKLIAYLKKTQELGANFFEGKENITFGKLSATQWNALFSKHIDHHLSQFGV